MQGSGVGGGVLKLLSLDFSTSTSTFFVSDLKKKRVKKTKRQKCWTVRRAMLYVFSLSPRGDPHSYPLSHTRCLFNYRAPSNPPTPPLFHAIIYSSLCLWEAHPRIGL